jgi:arginine/lysine/ornithine decarboxylase
MVLSQFYISTSGILAAMFSVLQLQKIFTKTNNKSTFLIPRNSHKSVFDGLKLTDSNAFLLPVIVENTFQVPAGTDISVLETAVLKFKDEVPHALIS